MESEQLQNLRAKIAEIKKQGYDIQTETKLIQELTYKPKPKKSFEDSLNSSEILEFSEEFLQLTYYNKEEGNLGCVHYHRNAKILTECCKNMVLYYLALNYLINIQVQEKIENMYKKNL